MAFVRDYSFRALYNVKKSDERLLLNIAKLNLPTYYNAKDTPIGLHYLIKNVVRKIMRKGFDDYNRSCVWTDIKVYDGQMWEITYFIDEIDPKLESLMIQNQDDGVVKEWYVFA